MRFLMVSIFYPPYAFGGDAVYVQRLAAELHHRGHEVDVVHCTDSSDFFGAPPKDFPQTDPHVTVHRLSRPSPRLGPLYSHQTGRPGGLEKELRQIFLSKEFDVVHFHNISLFGAKALSIPCSPGAARLYTMHDHWLVCPLNVLWKYNQRPCEAPDCIPCQLRAGRPPQLWRYTSLLADAAAHVDLFLASSHFSAELHRARGFDQPIDVLSPFTAEPPEESSPRPHERPYFLFVGRLQRYKGIHDALAAFSGAGYYDFLIAGEGDELRAVERADQLNPRIRYLGWMSQEKLHAYYNHALGVIVPSSGYESFGLVAMEAMAHGAPVVARRRGPLTEIVEESGGGLLFDTTEELREQCDRIAGDPALRARLAKAGRGAFESRWTADRHVREYLQKVAALRKRSQ